MQFVQAAKVAPPMKEGLQRLEHILNGKPTFALLRAMMESLDEYNQYYLKLLNAKAVATIQGSLSQLSSGAAQKVAQAISRYENKHVEGDYNISQVNVAQYSGNSV